MSAFFFVFIFRNCQIGCSTTPPFFGAARLCSVDQVLNLKHLLRQTSVDAEKLVSGFSKCM